MPDRDPTPRIQMFDGFNEGWIEFVGGSTHLGAIFRCATFASDECRWAAGDDGKLK
ncbi:MAG: hypothetical protein ACREF3_16155 [Acetobacteraceae bacterium]